MNNHEQMKDEFMREIVQRVWNILCIVAQLITVLMFVSSALAIAARQIEPIRDYLTTAADEIVLARIDDRMEEIARLCEWRRVDEYVRHVAETDGFVLVRGGSADDRSADFGLLIGPPESDSIGFRLHQRIATTVPVPRGYYYSVVRGWGLSSLKPPAALAEVMVYWVPRGGCVPVS